MHGPHWRVEFSGAALSQSLRGAAPHLRERNEVSLAGFGEGPDKLLAVHPHT
jgi:hypothetical protein